MVFLGEDVVERLDELGARPGRFARVHKRDHRQKGVPHGAFARLEHYALAARNLPVQVEGVYCARHIHLVFGEPLDVHHENRVNPRRLDSSPRAVFVLVFEQPLEHELYRAFPKRLYGRAVVGVQGVVELHEEVFPAQEIFVFAGQAVVNLVAPFGEELVELQFLRQLLDGSARRED